MPTASSPLAVFGPPSTILDPRARLTDRADQNLMPIPDPRCSSHRNFAQVRFAAQTCLTGKRACCDRLPDYVLTSTAALMYTPESRSDISAVKHVARSLLSTAGTHEHRVLVLVILMLLCEVARMRKGNTKMIEIWAQQPPHQSAKSRYNQAKSAMRRALRLQVRWLARQRRLRPLVLSRTLEWSPRVPIRLLQSFQAYTTSS